MTYKYDRSYWRAFWLDTPITPSNDANKRRKLAPGTCVKQVTPSPGVPECGRVHANQEGALCRVIGHGWNDSADEKFVWEGTKGEFEETWQAD